jgi:hypothetical protein
MRAASAQTLAAEHRDAIVPKGITDNFAEIINDHGVTILCFECDPGVADLILVPSRIPEPARRDQAGT